MDSSKYEAVFSMSFSVFQESYEKSGPFTHSELFASAVNQFICSFQINCS